MDVIDYRESQLEKWLRNRNMTTNEFLDLIGCSRPILWKVKRGKPITAAYAERIAKVTNGEIRPVVTKKGNK